MYVIILIMCSLANRNEPALSLLDIERRKQFPIITPSVLFIAEIKIAAFQTLHKEECH